MAVCRVGSSSWNRVDGFEQERYTGIGWSQGARKSRRVFLPLLPLKAVSCCALATRGGEKAYRSETPRARRALDRDSHAPKQPASEVTTVRQPRLYSKNLSQKPRVPLFGAGLSIANKRATRL